MQLTKLIEMLVAIETRHIGRHIEVEARDYEGFPMIDFDVTTEYVLPAKRIIVRLSPPKMDRS